MNLFWGKRVGTNQEWIKLNLTKQLNVLLGAFRMIEMEYWTVFTIIALSVLMLDHAIQSCNGYKGSIDYSNNVVYIITKSLSKCI